jgi:hypothetical protein
VQPFIPYRDIRKIDVAPRSLLIPTEHGIDGCCKLHGILLINTTSIYPEISKAISCSLVGAEVNLLPASLALAGASFYILKGDLLLIVGMPSMREYRVGWDFFAREFMDDEVTVGLALQEAHREGIERRFGRSLVEGVTRGAYQLPQYCIIGALIKIKLA